MFQRQDVRVLGLVVQRHQARAQRFPVRGRPVAVHVARQRLHGRLPGPPVPGRRVQADSLPPRQQPAAPSRHRVPELVPELAVQPAEPRQIVVVVLVAAQGVVNVVAQHVPLEARRQAPAVADVQVQRQ